MTPLRRPYRGQPVPSPAHRPPPTSKDSGHPTGNRSVDAAVGGGSRSETNGRFAGAHRGAHALPPSRTFFKSDENVVQDLLSQVTAIRDAATESEVVVRDITRDIQSLDLAKRNLVASMNALKRFQMLGTSRSAFPHPCVRANLTSRSQRLRPAHSTCEIPSIQRDGAGSRCRQRTLTSLQDFLERRQGGSGE
jgi:hypothetical protein